MKIYFCDGCNESIPVTAIQDGSVTTIKGKLFCGDCVPTGTAVTAAPASATVRGGSSPLLWVLVLLLIAWTAYREFGAPGAAATGFGETTQALESSDAEWRLSTVEKDVSTLRMTNEDVADQLDRQRSDVDQLRTTVTDLTRSADQLRDEVDGFARGQAEMGRGIERTTILENRADYLSERIDVLAGMINDMRGEVARVESLAEAGMIGVGASGGAMDTSPADATSDGEYAALRRRLLDPDASERFDAVSDIMDQRLKDLAPDLLEVLGDEDAFVKILAMEALGDFGYVEAVQPLFEVLDDPSPQIRKTAAETLIRLTGYDPGYDARGTQSERKKAVQAWSKWLADDANG